ncbi:hypothetical protein LBMAG42_35420 [Deltaproteobacteria bacterium]|nr:hypothetical protein LBMAG42_35420 [Deltaproteobacteria bacterium]
MTLPRIGLVALVLLLLSGAVWFLRPAPDEADRVRAVIHAVVAGAEAGDVGDVMAPLAEGFVAESDGLTTDKATVRSLVTAQLLRRGHITVLVGEIGVDVQGETAHASFDDLLAEAGQEWTEVLPVDGDSWHLEVDLRRTDDVWRVTRAARSDAPILQ